MSFRFLFISMLWGDRHLVSLPDEAANRVPGRAGVCKLLITKN